MKKNPVTELLAYIGQFTARCRAMRWLGALFHAGVVSEIASDIDRDRKHTEADAYSAEQADAEAYATLRQIATNGWVSKQGLPGFRQALRQIHRSGRIDHVIGQRARA